MVTRKLVLMKALAGQTRPLLERLNMAHDAPLEAVPSSWLEGSVFTARRPSRGAFTPDSSPASPPEHPAASLLQGLHSPRVPCCLSPVRPSSQTRAHLSGFASPNCLRIVLFTHLHFDHLILGSGMFSCFQILSFLSC